MSQSERLTFGHGLHLAVPSRPTPAMAAAIAHEPPPVRLSRIETWDWAWGGLLFFTIFLFFRPQDQIPGLGNSHAPDIAALLGLAAMVFLSMTNQRRLMLATPELFGVFGIGFIILATVPTSIWPGGALSVFTDSYLQLMLIFLLMVNSVTSPTRVHRISWVIVLAFGYMSALVIFNYVRGVNLMEGRAVGPVGGFFENPNDLATNLVTFLPLALMYARRPGAPLRRLTAAGISVLMLVAMVMTKSRGGTLGAVAMLATFLIVSRSLTPATIIGGVLVGMLAVPMIPDSFWARMASITDPSKDDTGSRAERKRLLEQGWIVFMDHPLTGVGAGQFKAYQAPGLVRWRETHNVLLQVAAELGIFGLLALLFLIARAMSAAWWTRAQLSWIYRKRTRGRPEPEDGLDSQERSFLETHGSAMIAAVVGWFVCAMFGSVAFNWTFYYVLGLAVTARQVIRARAAAYGRARAQGARSTVAA